MPESEPNTDGPGSGGESGTVNQGMSGKEKDKQIADMFDTIREDIKGIRGDGPSK